MLVTLPSSRISKRIRLELADGKRAEGCASLLKADGPDTSSQHALDGEQCDELLAIKMVLGGDPTKFKMEYMLKEPKCFGVLEAWSPSHPYLAWKKWTSVSTQWKDHPVPEFLATLRQVAVDEEIIFFVGMASVTPPTSNLGGALRPPTRGEASTP